MKEKSITLETREPATGLRGAVWRWFTQHFAWEMLQELYLGTFECEPDPREKEAYLASPQHLAPPADILDGLLRSEAFQRNSPAAIKASHEIVQALYRGFLERDSDEYGFMTYGKILRDEGPLVGLPKVVTFLTRSFEFQHRTSAHALSTLGAQGGRRINGQKVTHVVSLGTHCLTGFYLKKYQYKRFSLPFDWLFSSPETVLHCLEDDFAEFLDPRHFISLKGARGGSEPGADHAYYREKYKVYDMFTHRDPTNEADFLYFKRTVHRFHELLASEDAKLFVMIARPHQDAAKTFPALSGKLRAMTKNSAFICIQLKPPTKKTGCHHMRLMQSDGDHLMYEFRPCSAEFGVGFDEPLDDMAIMRLVRQYDVDLASVPATPDQVDAEA